MSDEDEAHEEGQYDSCELEEEESETEAERDTYLHVEGREKTSPVLHIQAGFASVDKRQMRIDEVTRSDDTWAHIKENVPEVWTNGCHKEKRTIRNALPFSKQTANVDQIENTTPNTPKAPNVPQT